MKSIFLLLFIIISGCLYAQSAAGVKAGLNISNVRNSGQNDFSSLLSYNAGVVFRFTISSRLLLNTEALLSGKGFISVIIPAGTTASHLQYVSFPLLGYYRLANRMYCQIGPELNFLLNAKMKNSTSHNSVAEYYKKTDFSLAGGLGYEIFKNFSLETRYSLGLS